MKRQSTAKTALFATGAVVALAAVFVFVGRGQEASMQDYDLFLSHLDRAQSIFVGQPLISSSMPPGMISEAEKLALAKEILSAAQPVTRLEDGSLELISDSLNSNAEPKRITPEDLENRLFMSGHPLLLYPDSEREPETTNRYWLVTGNNLCCLLVRWDMAEEKELVAYYTSASNVIERLSELARQEATGISPSTFYYNQYYNRLNSAVAMWRNSAMLHNSHVLTDVAELERLKELLTLELLTEEEEAWTWDGVWDGIISFTNTPPDADWTGSEDCFYYVSMEENGQYYILLATSGDQGSSTGIYVGRIPEGNWEKASRKFEEAPTVDDRQCAARNASYEGFLDLVEKAVSIQLEEGGGQTWPHITDSEWLEQARIALLTVEPLPEDTSDLVGASEDWLRQEVGTASYAITLTTETGDPVTYYINRIPSTNTDYIIFPMKEYPVNNTQTECTFYRLGIFPGKADYALWIAANVVSGRFGEPTGAARIDLSGLTVHR